MGARNDEDRRILVRRLGRQDYATVFEAMRNFTQSRSAEDLDELWFVEHPPVFTQGLAGKPEHLLDTDNIPVVQSDRGGQVTYHGPGQIVAYLLIDTRRARLGVRRLVSAMEDAIIALLEELGIGAHARAEAPGVYVGDAKIASLGLRIRRGCSYHGLSLNVAMDLAPFTQINPCGYAGLRMTQIGDLCDVRDLQFISDRLLRHLLQHLGYNAALDPTGRAQSQTEPEN